MVNLSLIFPCYNEEEGISDLANQIGPVVKQLQKNHQLELIFVDDGSTDKTNEMLHQFFGHDEKVKIIKHEKNKNLGAALKTGFAYATGDLIATFDSDCTYSPELIFPMLKRIEDADIVTCFAGNTENVPRWRMFLSNSASQMYRVLVSPKVHVYTCMIRVYKKEVLQNMRIERDDFLAVLEIMVKSVLKGYKVKELPATMKSRRFGTTKMNTLKTIMSHLNFMKKIIFYRLFNKKL